MSSASESPPAPLAAVPLDRTLAELCRQSGYVPFSRRRTACAFTSPGRVEEVAADGVLSAGEARHGFELPPADLRARAEQGAGE